MFSTRLTGSKFKRPLTIAKTKKAAVDSLHNECKRLTGSNAPEDQFETVEGVDLAILWRLGKGDKKTLADGKAVVIKPLG